MIWGRSKHKFLRPKEGPSKQTKSAQGYWGAGDGGGGGSRSHEHSEGKEPKERRQAHALHSPSEDFSYSETYLFKEGNFTHCKSHGT